MKKDSYIQKFIRTIFILTLVIPLQQKCFHKNATKTDNSSTNSSILNAPEPDDLKNNISLSTTNSPENYEKELASGKKKAVRIEPEGGFVFSVSNEQLQMLSEKNPAFTIQARLSRGIENCEADIESYQISESKQSNFEEIMGGKMKPDSFLIAKKEDGKIIAIPYQVNNKVAEKIKLLFSQLEDKKLDKNDCKEIEKVIEADPGMPLVNFAASGCWQKVGEIQKAHLFIDKELEVNPSNPEALLAKADILLSVKDKSRALEKIAEALFYYPSWEAPRKYLNIKSEIGCKIRSTSFDPKIFIDVNKNGVVIAGYLKSQKWLEPYALCKAAFRYCPSVRTSFGMKAFPYKLSLFEELVCLEITAKEGKDLSNADENEDENLKMLLSAFNNDDLIPFTIFEIIGRLNPNYMKFLPEDIKNMVLDYIKSYIIVDEKGTKSCNMQ